MLRKLLILAVGLLWLGCGPSFVAVTPPGFVEIENEYDSYDFRATSADGLVIAVREIEHDPQGTTEFWIQAIKNRMRDRGGYALLETVTVKSGDGIEGTQLRFGHDEEGNRPHLYYVTLFITESSILLLEAGGTKKLMTDHAAELGKAVSQFRTN
ncbi:MAG: serine/threonine protein kinase [Deltaproteobacteria bacterium]|nr:MAG: serine/threonine protein kinase [Deltaproteobacteria bacterium]